MTAMFTPALAASPGTRVSLPLVASPSYANAGQQLRWALFNQGANGLYLDPQPRYLYRDTAGTLPVTAPGDLVGLGRDRHKGLTLGPELVTNGGFDTDLSGWSSSHFIWDNGVARETSTSGGSITQSIPYTPSAYYLVSFSMREVAGGSPSFQWPMGNVIDSWGTDQDVSIIVKAPDTTGESINFIGAAATYTLDNVSVRELPGNHVTQPISTYRPMYGAEGVRHWLYFNGDTSYFEFPLVSYEGALTFSMAVMFHASMGTDMVLGKVGSSNSGDKIGINVGGYFVRLVDGQPSLTGGTADTSPHVMTVTRDANGVIALYVDGALTAQHTQPLATVSFDLLGASWNQDQLITQQHFQGDLYGIVMAPGVDEREKIERHLANLAGITL